MWKPRAAVTGLLVAALAGAAAGADDTRKAAPAQDPDPGFLEFLGGVDGLSDVNPDYLAQANSARPAASRAPTPANPTPQPPAPASVPGEKSNE